MNPAFVFYGDILASHSCAEDFYGGKKIYILLSEINSQATLLKRIIMTRNWLITEKIIAIIEIIFGIITLYISYISVSHLIDLFLQSADNKWADISIFSLIRHYHFGLLTGLLGIFSGIFLLRGKRLGWITSLMNITMMITGFIIITVFDKYSNSIKDYLFRGFLICPLILFFVLLLFKPFRDKYHSVKSTLLLVTIINVLFIADYFINHIRISDN